MEWRVPTNVSCTCGVSLPLDKRLKGLRRGNNLKYNLSYLIASVLHWIENAVSHNTLLHNFQMSSPYLKPSCVSLFCSSTAAGVILWYNSNNIIYSNIESSMFPQCHQKEKEELQSKAPDVLLLIDKVLTRTFCARHNTVE